MIHVSSIGTVTMTVNIVLRKIDFGITDDLKLDEYVRYASPRDRRCAPVHQFVREVKSVEPPRGDFYDK